MPRFDYSAIDRQGQSVQGQIEAGTRDEAALSLTKSGLLVSRLAEASAARISQTSAAPPPKLAPQPKVAAQPQAGLARGVPVAAAPSPQAAVIHTPAGSDKDIYFVFSMLQSYAHAGLNPVEALTNVANGYRNRSYSEALRAAAGAAKEGRRISEVFARYVDLFPPHVVGMVRAAEEGGFFPEAYGLISDQAMASNRLRRWFKWLLGVAIMVGICLPLAALLLRAGLDSWDVQDRTGGQASGWGTFYGSIGRELLWPTGPVIVVLVLAVWGFARFWQSRARREMRHALVLRLPTVNRRARAEGLSVFAWTMGMLSKTGLPPRTVWERSVATIPNLALRAQLEHTARQMTESTRLSEAFQMTPGMPDEYGPIVQTGEVTGDVATALERASQAQLEEFKASDQGVKTRVGCWMFLLMVLGCFVIIAMYYGGFMKPLMDKILAE